MVPVCSMTKRSVIAGMVGSSPINFSATITWAELETGNNSVAPWIKARTNFRKADHIEKVEKPLAKKNIEIKPINRPTIHISLRFKRAQRKKA